MENNNFENNNSNINVLLFNTSLPIPQNTIIVSKSEIESSWRKGRLKRYSQIIVSFFEPFYERIKKMTIILDFFTYTCARMRINKIHSFIVMCRENKDNTIKNLTIIRLEHDYNDYNFHLICNNRNFNLIGGES